MRVLEAIRNTSQRELADSHSLARVFSVSVGLRLLSALILFFISVLLANWLGPEGYGLYAIVFSAASVIGIPITCGLPTLLTRETATLTASAKFGLWKGLLKLALALVVVISIAGAAVLGIYSFSSEDATRLATGYGAIAIALAPVMGLDRLRGAIMQGLGSALWAQIPEALIRPGALLVALLIGVYGYTGNPLAYAIAAYAVAALISFAAGSLLLKRLVGGRLTGVNPEYRAKEWLLSLLSLGMLSSTQTIVVNADILILGWLASAGDVAAYKVALQGVVLMMIVQIGIGEVLSTRFSRCFASRDLAGLAYISDRSVVFSSLAAIGTLAAFVLFGERAIHLLFGNGYDAAFAVLLVLAAGHLINALSGPAINMILMGGFDKTAIKAVALGGGTAIFMAILLVPRFSSLGMAIASATGAVITRFFMAILVKQKLDFDPSILGAIRRLGVS